MKIQLFFGVCVLVAVNARSIFSDLDEEVEELLGFQEDIPVIPSIVKNLPGFPKFPISPGLKLPHKGAVTMLDIINLININKKVAIKMFSIFIAVNREHGLETLYAVKQVIDEVQCKKPGDRGSGDRGSGDRGSGDRGSGDRGSGDRGSGDRGSGDRGSGDRGSGDRGSGDRGSGDRGSGGGPRPSGGPTRAKNSIPPNK